LDLGGIKATDHSSSVSRFKTPINIPTETSAFYWTNPHVVIVVAMMSQSDNAYMGGGTHLPKR